MMYAPRMTGVSSYAAQAELCVAWLTLKPDGSCAHDWAKGAALSSAVRCAAVFAVAVADAASATVAAPTRASAQKRLCIDSLRLVCAGRPIDGGACSLPRPLGRPAHEPKTTARYLS